VAPIAEPWELYDLSTDRTESTELAIVHRAKLTEMIAEWESLMTAHAATASADLDPASLKQVDPAQPTRMNDAQEIARPKRTQVLLNGESFLLEGRHAFLMKPTTPVEGGGKPWIFYGPTLKNTPDKAESWMHQQFIEAGIAVAGIDVGEAYGSPRAFPYFEALRAEMVSQGYAEKPALLGRSRGGLWASSWAIEHPEWAAGLGGIYPVYDFTTYPGLKKAAPMYGLTEEGLLEEEANYNPIRKAAVLAKAKIPVHIIHGTDDKVVPLAENSATLEKIYQENGAGDLITLVRAEGQGHSFWEGFFTHQPLVDFLIKSARAGAAE